MYYAAGKTAALEKLGFSKLAAIGEVADAYARSMKSDHRPYWQRAVNAASEHVSPRTLRMLGYGGAGAIGFTALGELSGRANPLTTEEDLQMGRIVNPIIGGASGAYMADQMQQFYPVPTVPTPMYPKPPPGGSPETFIHEVKKQYPKASKRDLMMMFHPDRASMQGVPREILEKAFKLVS